MHNSSRRPQSDLYSSEQIKRILNGAGIDIVKEVDSDYIIYCPYHNNNRTPAGEVSKTTGIFFCFSCQITKPIVEFVMDISGRTYFEATRFIKNKEQNIDIEKQVNQTLYQKPIYVEYDTNLINRLGQQALDSDRAVSYFASRQINTDSMKKFTLGYSQKQDMITVPVHSPDGLALGFVARTIEGKEFKNTPNLPKSKVLFNLHRIKHSDIVYVVESSFDAVRLDQLEFPAVATLGANVSKVQCELLQKYFNEIVVITDNDDAGDKMYDRIVDSIGGRVSRIKLDSQYKDIGDMSDDNIKKLKYSFDRDILEMIGY